MIHVSILSRGSITRCAGTFSPPSTEVLPTKTIWHQENLHYEGETEPVTRLVEPRANFLNEEEEIRGMLLV